MKQCYAITCIEHEAESRADTKIQLIPDDSNKCDEQMVKARMD